MTAATTARRVSSKSAKKKPAGLFTIDGEKGTPVVGVSYRVDHSRKGIFRMCVSKVDGEWAAGFITDGHASAANPDNERAEGEEITVRAGLCQLLSEKIPDNEWDGKPLPIERWGRDHVSTLLYIENVCTDGGGKPSMERMRQEPGRPRKGWDNLHADGIQTPAHDRYATRLKDGFELFGHDDFDCAADMVHAGLLLWNGTSLQPVFALTDRGWKVAANLRKQRAEGRKVSEFVFEPV